MVNKTYTSLKTIHVSEHSLNIDKILISFHGSNFDFLRKLKLIKFLTEINKLMRLGLMHLHELFRDDSIVKYNLLKVRYPTSTAVPNIAL